MRRTTWLRLLDRPYAPRLVASNLLVRLSAGAVALALVLFFEEARDSFAVAGIVAGAFAFGTALGSPVVGRLIDRHGQTRVLLATAIGHAGALGFLLVASAGPVWALAALGFAAGSSRPPLPACMRTLWLQMLADEEDRRRSYRLESVLLEVGFIAGPVVTGLLVAFATPGSALVAAALSSALPTVVFALSPPSRQARGQPGRRGLSGALGSPGIAAILGARLALGSAIGAVQVGAAAYAAARGQAGASGALLSAFAVGSLIGGVSIRTASARLPVEGMYVRLSAGFGVGLLPLLAAPGIAGTLVLFAVAGLFLAPLNAAVYELTDRLAVPGTETEARIWTSTAVAAGSALGSGVGGWVVDVAAARGAFVLAAGSGAVAAVAAAASKPLLSGTRFHDDERR